MIKYQRKYPFFSLCGLNCGLCPRYQTTGISKCPGCGGPDFHLKHPSCSVITCSKKHDNIEYCYQCSEYPCNRYNGPCKADSFISYRNVVSDFIKADKYGLEQYIISLNDKMRILEYLISNYNDGRSKSFYCLAVNLIDLSDLNNIMEQIDRQIKFQDIDIKSKAKLAADLFYSTANKRNIVLKLIK